MTLEYTTAVVIGRQPVRNRSQRLADSVRTRLLAVRLAVTLRHVQTELISGLWQSDDWCFTFFAREARVAFPRLPAPGRLDMELYGKTLFDAARRANHRRRTRTYTEAN